jgi:hypothetical protein
MRTTDNKDMSDMLDVVCPVPRAYVIAGLGSLSYLAQNQ